MYKSPAKGGGYAQLKEFDLTQFQKANALQISVANVMNVASMVVGQYYMSVINSKLINMTRSIKKIEDFQEKEFQSRILSVTTLVGEISQFSSEILEDKEQRSHKLLMLEVHKKTATELLGQIDLKIAEITNKNPKPKFKEYLMIVDDFQRLVGYQDILLAVLAEMCKLTYFLSKGGISMEQSRSSFKNYLGMSSAARIRLCEWHDNQIKNFNLNLELNRKERGGFARTVRQPMIYFNDKQKFEEIPIDLVNKIRRQSKELTESDPETKDVYNESVVIVIKEGKYYFLHEPANSNIICDVS